MPLPMIVESPLYTHQEKVLRKLQNGRVLWGGVGTGKSRVAATYYLRNEAPKDVYVITTARKRDSGDWEDEFYAMGLSPRAHHPGSGAGLGGEPAEGVWPRELSVRGPRSGSKKRRKSLRNAGAVRRPGSAVAAEVLQERDSAGRGLAGDTDSGGNSPGRRNLERIEGQPQLAYDGVRTVRVTGLRGRGESGSEWLSEGARGISGGRIGVRAAGASVLPRHARVGHRVGQSESVAATHGGGMAAGIGQSSTHSGGGSSGVSERCPEPSGDILATESYNFPYVVTVDSWQNIKRYVDVAGAFFIFDEQRLVGSGEWTKAFHRIARRNNWLLLTGTPGDNWMDYIPLFVAHGFFKNKSAMLAEHAVFSSWSKFPKVERWVDQGPLYAMRSALLVEMPFERHTRRMPVEVPLGYDKELLDQVLKKRWHVYEDRPLRDAGEMCMVARKVVNSDPSRLQMVEELWKNHPRLIIFYNYNYELHALRSLTEIYLDTTTGDSSTRPQKQWPGSPSGTNFERSGQPDSPTRSTSAGIWTPTSPSSAMSTPGARLRLTGKSRDALPVDSPGVPRISTDSTTSTGCPATTATAEWNGQTCLGMALETGSNSRIGSSNSSTMSTGTRTSGSTSAGAGLPSLAGGRLTSPKTSLNLETTTRESGLATSTRTSTEGCPPRLTPSSTTMAAEWANRENPVVLNAKTVGRITNDQQVYIGRPSKWGNPFVIGKDGNRDEVIAKYEKYIRSSPLRQDIGELRGKNLVCWCSPEACHGDVLLRLSNMDSSSVAIAEWNGHKHQEVPTTDRWLYFAQYTAAAEAWNCITTDAMIFYSQNYSWKIMEQSEGRIDRLNSPFNELWYYKFTSDSWIDRAITRAVEAKRVFNESELKPLFRG